MELESRINVSLCGGYTHLDLSDIGGLVVNLNGGPLECGTFCYMSLASKRDGEALYPNRTRFMYIEVMCPVYQAYPAWARL